MKTFILALGILTSLTTYAMVPSDVLPNERVVQYCSFRGGMDYGYGVRVVENMNTGRNYLLVAETTIAGVKNTRELAHKSVRRVPGAPVVWTTQSHQLVINFTTTPRPEGRIGQLTVLRNMHSVAVNCTYIGKR
jgi:hypothetical protein